MELISSVSRTCSSGVSYYIVVLVFQLYGLKKNSKKAYRLEYFLIFVEIVVLLEVTDICCSDCYFPTPEDSIFGLQDDLLALFEESPRSPEKTTVALWRKQENR